MRRRLVLWCVLSSAAAMLASVPGVAAAGADATPAVVYQSGDDTVVADSAGEEIVRIPVLFHPTLDGNVVAGEGVGGGAGIAEADTSPYIVVAHDATTGDALWTVLDARFPIVLDDGDKVAFLPSADGARDPQVNSIWMADAQGDERLVVQFANGPGLPGYDPGFEGDNGLLAVSFDEAGETAAVTQGNEADLFIYDIFAVDVATGAVTRLTDDKQSRSPAMSPGGDRVVFGRDTGICGEVVLLHPVLAASADPVVQTSSFDAGTGMFSVPARTTAVFVEVGPDTTPPVATAELVLVSGTGIGRSEFQVVASCTDDRDPAPSLAADINGAPVIDGQVVVFVPSRNARWEDVDGVLTVYAKRFVLTATCTDAAGNVGAATAVVRLGSGRPR